MLSIALVYAKSAYRDFLDDGLKAEAFDVGCYQDPEIALQHFAGSVSPNLVVTGLYLGQHMNGYDFGQKVCRLYPTARVIYLSEVGMTINEKQLSKCEIIVAKPLNVGEFAEMARRHAYLE